MTDRQRATATDVTSPVQVLGHDDGCREPATDLVCVCDLVSTDIQLEDGVRVAHYGAMTKL